MSVGSDPTTEAGRASRGDQGVVAGYLSLGERKAGLSVKM